MMQLEKARTLFHIMNHLLESIQQMEGYFLKVKFQQQIKKQMRFMYEEESHYYIDVLCDEYCEIDAQN